jgi:SAM-dependent methyltransferase
LGYFRELGQLFNRSRRASNDLPQEIARLIQHVRVCEQFLQRQTGIRCTGLKMLEIGTGQLPRQIGYFSLHNDVIGIDLDVIPLGFDAGAYLKLLRQNGPKRLLKTIGRKLTGFDSSVHSEIARQLGVPRLPYPQLQQMDATRLKFPDNTFDVIYSFDVFEHLPDPAAVTRESIRVLRPGGALLIFVHPYTASNGCHDLRMSHGNWGGLPHWPHLRPQHASLVRQFAYLNKMTLAQWHEFFDRLVPGWAGEHYRASNDDRAEVLKQMRLDGELPQYSDEDLMTDRLIAVWQKPA